MIFPYYFSHAAAFNGLQLTDLTKDHYDAKPSTGRTVRNPRMLETPEEIEASAARGMGLG